MRRELVGDRAPRFSGLVAWRAAIALPASVARELPDGEYWGQGKLFGCLRMGGRRVHWFGGWRASEQGGDDPDRERQALIAAFDDCAPPLSRVVEATPASAVLRNAPYDRRPARRWSRGRITLAGDAAHPMLPNIGQGACQALEDALALADELAAAPSVPDALARCERRRRRRTAAIVRQSRQMARRADVSGPLAVRARNALLRAMPGAVVRRRVEVSVGRA